MNSAMRNLQTTLVTALKADAGLSALIGANRIFDAAPKALRPPYIVIGRHDADLRDAQETQLTTHLIDWHIWLSGPHRCDGLNIAEQLCSVLFSVETLDGGATLVQSRNMRTESAITPRNGWTRILVQTQFKLDISTV